MKQIAGELRHQAHMLNADLVAMVRDPGFEEAMGRADNDADTKALLMVGALKEIALDPLSGNTLDAFRYPNGDTVTFNIRFDRWVNFIGLFALPADSRRARQVSEAIEANLKSQMFKAATMHRRLERRRPRLYEQAQTWARKVYENVRAAYGGQFPSREAMETANIAYNKVVDGRMANINARLQRIGDVAAPGFKGSYSEAVAKFFYRNLPFGVDGKGAPQWNIRFTAAQAADRSTRGQEAPSQCSPPEGGW